MTVVAGAAVSMRRALHAAFVLGFSVVVLSLSVAAVAPMTGLTATSAHAAMAGMGESSEALGAAAAVTTASVADEITVDAGLAVASMCERACTSSVTSTCTAVVGLIVSSLLVLLLATRRDTVMRLLARLRTSARTLRPRRQRTMWTAMSLSSLCVLRV